MQAITYGEVVPALGVDLATYGGYDATVDSRATVEFASGPLRLHTMLNTNADRVLADGSSGGSVSNTAIFAFAVPGSIYSAYVQGGVDSILRGMLVTPDQQHDLQLVDGLRNINPQVGLGVVGEIAASLRTTRSGERWACQPRRRSPTSPPTFDFKPTSHRCTDRSPRSTRSSPCWPKTGPRDRFSAKRHMRCMACSSPQFATVIASGIKYA
jgi:hypothetical protein